MQPILVPHTASPLEFSTGLIGQFPYQALEKTVHHLTLDVTNDYQLTSDTNSPEGDPQASTEDYEKEDEEAFNYQAQPRRLMHDSCLHNLCPQLDRFTTTFTHAFSCTNSTGCAIYSTCVL